MIIRRFLNTYFSNTNNLITFIHNNFWSKFFISIIISLVVLALLSIWGANFLERIVDPLKFTKDTSVIVEIFPESSKEKTNSKKLIIEEYLKTNSNIISFNVVSNEELSELIKGWTNVLNNLSDFSFPIIINVDLDPKSTYTANDLQLVLNQKVNNVYVQSEKSLATKLTSSINISRSLILLIPIVLFFIIFIVVLFTTVGLVYTQRESIAVLSFLGAPYGAVAKEFAFWTFKRALKGCIIGFISALILVELLVILLQLGWLILPSKTTIFLMLGVIGFIPLESAIITFFWVRRVIKWVV